MKIKQHLSLLAAGLLLAACTSENIVEVPVPQPGTGDNDDRREVLLTLKNKLNVGDPATKAIATAEENYIRSLDIYVFGATQEGGPYTFQELFYFRDDASTLPGNWAHSFNLVPTTADHATSSALLKLSKGLFIKLYCVANRTDLYSSNTAGVVTGYTNFQPITQTAPGQAGNIVTPGIPTEADFLDLHALPINPATVAPTENDVLVTPLPMTGSYTTPLDLTDFSVSTRTQLSFKLSRMVARFDVVNNAQLSKFTVETISMVNGQRAASFFPIKTLDTDPADLIAYPERAISADTQQAEDPANNTTSLTKGAFYTWASPKDDKGYLIFKGKYAVNQTENVDVTYQIPFQQIQNGVGSFIEVAYNHRYTISITDADRYHLDFTLNVSDWDDEGELDNYDPDNDFDNTTPIVLEAALSTNATVLANGNIELQPVAGSKFAFKMASNTALTEEVVYKNGGDEWLVKDVTRTKASMETTFAYKVDDSKLGGNLKNVTIRLTNPASGKRKEIVVVPKAVAPAP